MACNSAAGGGGGVLPINKLDELIHLLWGTEIREDIFQRWNQGFVFSNEEPTALIQHDGGPCAVIVPAQAYLFKTLLFTSGEKEKWRQTTGVDRDHALCQALADILCQVSSCQDSVTIVSHRNKKCTSADITNPGQKATDTESQQKSSGPESVTGQSVQSATDESKELVEDSNASPKRVRFSHEWFHSELRCVSCSRANNLSAEIEKFLPLFSGDHGVLLFLYSIILTKGIEQLKKEMTDLGEALIDPTHGHGSQSLINLLITGKAVPYVWDNEMDVSGLKLQGIHCKSSIGFLTLLEHFRYCEVGWNLKNPVFPIWLLGSETHLTILFSEDRTLVGEESSEELARRMFNSFDKEGRGFITVDSLGPLLQLLSLVSMPEYVKIMAEKLDPEQLGVITLNSFLEEFYSSEKPKHNTVHTFTVFHYNGLPRSSPNNKVRYAEASCAIMDMPETQMFSDFSQIKSCLLTKWPTIELTWKNNEIPSLN